MDISEEELRQLVRDSIARLAVKETRASGRAEPTVASTTLSFGRFLTLTPSEDGQCVIEPTVRCNHCGYCQSYGH